MKHITVCITSINKPIFLVDLIKNAKKYSYTEFNIIIIGDYKSPSGNKDYINSLSKKFSADIRYLDVRDQKSFLKKYRNLNKILPYNWGGRKMLANFISILERSPITVQIDDDNFIQNNDFFNSHSIVGTVKKINTLSSKLKWVNVYESLIEHTSLPIYPRGFLAKHRFVHNKINKELVSHKIAACNGLVLGDPDIDAFTRMFWPINVIAIKKKYLPFFAIKPGNWCTWNNQNTSTYLDVTKVYFTPHSVGRNADIWSSMLVCKLASHLNEVICFGSPVVKQIRNLHSNYKDYEDERLCNLYNEDFEDFLRNTKLKSTNYSDCLSEVIDHAEKLFKRNSNNFSNNFIRDYFEEYKIWHEEVSRIS